MGAFGSRVVHLVNGCYTIDGVHARLYSVEQRMLTIERTQAVLDRKYSDMTNSDELSRQQLRNVQHEIKQMNYRIDILDQHNDMEEIVVLRS